MAILLADLRAELYNRSAELLASLGLSTTTDAPNSNFDGPIGWGYGRIGKIPVAGLYPTDADLSTLGTLQGYNLLDFAEYRLLANIRNRWTLVRVQVGSNALYLSDVRDALDRRLTELAKMLSIDEPVLTAGSIRRTQAPIWDADEFGAICWTDGRWCR